MNCCDEYGDCQQSDTCPARTGVVLPHQAAHAARVARIKATRPRTCDDLGICQGRGSCACTHPVPSEAGNFKIVDLGPDDIGAGLGAMDGIRQVYALTGWLLVVLAVVVALVLLVSYSTEAHTQALWAFLQGVS